MQVASPTTHRESPPEPTTTKANSCFDSFLKVCNKIALVFFETIAVSAFLAVGVVLTAASFFISAPSDLILVTAGIISMLIGALLLLQNFPSEQPISNPQQIGQL